VCVYICVCRVHLFQINSVPDIYVCVYVVHIVRLCQMSTVPHECNGAARSFHKQTKKALNVELFCRGDTTEQESVMWLLRPKRT